MMKRLQPMLAFGAMILALVMLISPQQAMLALTCKQTADELRMIAKERYDVCSRDPMRAAFGYCIYEYYAMMAQAVVIENSCP